MGYQHRVHGVVTRGCNEERSDNDVSG